MEETVAVMKTITVMMVMIMRSMMMMAMIISATWRIEVLVAM